MKGQALGSKIVSISAHTNPNAQPSRSRQSNAEHVC
jgi:hypothetical protein